MKARVSVPRIGLALILWAVLWLPLLFGSHLPIEAAGLVDLSSTANPYFVPSRAVLLYLGFPLVLTSAIVAVMTPGLLLALGLPGSTAEAWIVRGFGLTLPLVSAGVIVLQASVGRPVVGAGFVGFLAVLSVICAIWAGFRVRAGRGAWPLTGEWKMVVGAALVVPFVMSAALAPKLLWESFNGDGAHAMASARMAVAHAFPFWDPGAGTVANFPGMSTMLFAFPAAWFVRLFGELELAVRAPYLMVLVVAHSAIALVAATGRRDLSKTSLGLIWLGLLVYTVMQAYSATYDPYSADLSMPGLPDTLQVVAFLGFLHAYLTRSWIGAAWWLILTLTSSPAGLMLVLFWLAAAWWFMGPAGRGDVLRGAGLLATAMVCLGSVPSILAWVGAPMPGREHGLFGLLRRFAFLQFTDWRRFVWVIVPVGIAPFLSFAAWPRLDAVGKALLAVTFAYFVTFYVQAFVMIHHFVPAMLLPVVVWWRIESGAGGVVTRWRIPATVGAGLLALGASLPRTTAVVTVAREVGSAVEDRGGGYSELDPGAFLRLDLLETVLPTDADPSVPDQLYGGSPLAWGYYAHRGNAGTEANYILSGPGDVSPTGQPPRAANGGGGLFVRDDSVLNQHRALRPLSPAGSRIYWNKRGMLFGRPPQDAPWILDLPAILEALGVDVEDLRHRLEGDP